MRKKDALFWISVSCGGVVIALIVLPLIHMMSAPSISMMKQSILDREVRNSIGLSIFTALAAALISFAPAPPSRYRPAVRP